MLVVVAGRGDAGARGLVERWRAWDAGLLTADDLSTVGWRYRPGEPSAPSAAVVGGRVVDTGTIRGVLTRLPCVVPDDLPHVIPEDRSYVASEMTAFLTAWLSDRSCPVLNRPVPGSLAGPCWGRERWIRLAGQIGVPARPVTRHAGLGVDEPPEEVHGRATTVTVIGERSFGDADALLHGWARRLAGACRAEMLAAHFVGAEASPALLTADVWPDMGRSEIADAALAYLLDGEET
ncbi:MAG TPA: hypothetical protein VGM69_08515 [Chloroflexota bacterium]|jgi:hypothetical protein